MIDYLDTLHFGESILVDTTNYSSSLALNLL